VLGDESGRDDLHRLTRAGRLVHRAPRLLGQAEDLARQRAKPPAPGVSAMPRPSPTKRSSASSLRSAATATETAGSVT